MVRCYECKYLTNTVQFSKDKINGRIIEIWNKRCQKHEEIVTDTLFDDRECEDYEL